MNLNRRAFTKCLLAAGAAAPAFAQKDFQQWPAGKSPKEIGKRVAERFVASKHMRPTTAVIYPEVCAWYGSLTYSYLAKDTDLNKNA